MFSALQPLHVGLSCRSSHGSAWDQSRIDTDVAEASRIRNVASSEVHDIDKLALGSPVSSCSTTDSIPMYAQGGTLRDHRDGDELSETQHAIAGDVLIAPPPIRLKFKEIGNQGQCPADDGFMLPPAALESAGFLLDRGCDFFDGELDLGSPVSSCSTTDSIPRYAQEGALRDHCDGDELLELQHAIAGDVLIAPPPIRLKFKEIENQEECLVDDGFMLPPAALECDGFLLDHGSDFFDEGFLVPLGFAGHADENVDAKTSSKLTVLGIPI